MLDRLDPRALAGALPGPRPRGRRRPGGPSPASARRYRARRAAQQAKTLARDRLRAVAVDGKTSRGARRAGSTRGCLPGAAEHGGRLPDHLEVGDGHNETSHFTELLRPLDLDGAVVTSGALHTVRANLDWLVMDKKAHFIAIVKGNQPTLQRAIYDLIQAGCPRDPDHVEIDYGHGRIIKRSLWVADAEGLDFPHVKRAVRIRRDGYDVAGTLIAKEIVHAVTTLGADRATPADLASLARGQWGIESVHWVRSPGVTRGVA